MAITGKKDHGHSLVAATLLISRQFSKRCELGNPYSVTCLNRTPRFK
jgi:hypothetical protein